MKVINKKMNFNEINELIDYLAKLVIKNKKKKYMHRSYRRSRNWKNSIRQENFI